MTGIIQSETAPSQDVMATLRDLLQTLREVLARMPVVRDTDATGDGSARSAGAQELADMMHGTTRVAPVQQQAR